MLKRRIAAKLTCSIVSGALIFGSVPAFAATDSTSVGTWDRATKTLVLNGVSRPDAEVVLPAGSTISVSSYNAVNNIYCEGDLTITGSGILSTSNSSTAVPGMSQYPGIVGKTSIAVEGVSLVDSSNGPALTNISGFGKMISIRNASVDVQGGSKYYGIISRDDVEISSSTVTVGSGYSEVGLFAMDRMSISSSDVTVAAGGKYTVAAITNLSLGRGQQVSSPSGAAVGTFRDTMMFTTGRNISTVVQGKATAMGTVSFSQATAYNVTVVNGVPSSNTAYPGETVSIYSTLGSDKIFKSWTSSSGITFLNPTATSTSFEMPANDVTITSVFEEVAKPAPEPEPETVSPEEDTTGKDGDASADKDPTKDQDADVEEGKVGDTDKDADVSKPEDIDTDADYPEIEEDEEDEDDDEYDSDYDDTFVEVTKKSDGSIVKATLTEDSLSIITTKSKKITSEAEYDVDDDELSLTSLTTSASIVEVPDTIKVGGEYFKVTEIESGALRGNTKMTKLKVGKYVTYIGAKACKGCKNLRKVTLTKNIKSIGKHAFKGINANATIQVKASFNKFRSIRLMIKKSGIAKTVKVKRI